MPESMYGDGHLTMIDPAFQHLDGKLWVNVAYDTGTAGGTWQVDVAKNKWTQVKYPEGSPSARAYDVVATSKNDMYWHRPGRRQDLDYQREDAADDTGTSCRRKAPDAGADTSTHRIVYGARVFQGNRLAMFDPRTKKITEWTVPTEWTRPYDAQFDDRGYLWTAGMDADLAVRMNVETGEFVQYLLPHRTNVRQINVQNVRSLLQHVGRAISTAIQSRASSRWRPENRSRDCTVGRGFTPRQALPGRST